MDNTVTNTIKRTLSSSVSCVYKSNTINDTTIYTYHYHPIIHPLWCIFIFTYHVFISSTCIYKISKHLICSWSIHSSNLKLPIPMSNTHFEWLSPIFIWLTIIHLYNILNILEHPLLIIQCSNIPWRHEWRCAEDGQTKSWNWNSYIYHMYIWYVDMLSFTYQWTHCPSCHMTLYMVFYIPHISTYTHRWKSNHQNHLLHTR